MSGRIIIKFWPLFVPKRNFSLEKDPFLRGRTIDRCGFPVDITDLDSIKLICRIYLPDIYAHYNQGPGPHHLWELFNIKAINVKKWRERYDRIDYRGYDGVARLFLPRYLAFRFDFLVPQHCFLAFF